MNRRSLLAFVNWIAAALVLSVGLGSLPAFSPVVAPAQTRLTVSAAISLTNALQELKPIYQSTNPNVNITYNFASSGALQQQIEQGAPVDVFFSAAAKQMDALQQKKLLAPETRRSLLTNRLVLITSKNGSVLSSFRDLTSSRVQRIAIGAPKSVPAGQYAQQLLTNLKILNAIKPKLVYGNNVRQVLTYVENGNVDAGIVYTTDAKESKSVRVEATAPENLHSPIIYPIAVLKDSKNATTARNFVQFLSSSEAQGVFQNYGFGIVRS
jgi:molybdate transport system substrate-binding protein